MAEFLPSGGYIELASSLFTHDQDNDETIAMTVVTEQLSGLLLWQGQTPSHSNSKDFIAVALDNGKVQFRLRSLFSAEYALICYTTFTPSPAVARRCGVAWVIGPRGGLQLCRPQKS